MAIPKTRHIKAIKGYEYFPKEEELFKGRTFPRVIQLSTIKTDTAIQIIMEYGTGTNFKKCVPHHGSGHSKPSTNGTNTDVKMIGITKLFLK